MDKEMREQEHRGTVALGDPTPHAQKPSDAILAMLDAAADKSMAAAISDMTPDNLRRLQVAIDAALPPQHHVVACPCTLIEQDEDCQVGYPSMLCGICKGNGNTTPEQVTALACEMIKIASDIGEPEDPFAAWESIDLLKSHRDQLREALKPFAAASYTGPNGVNHEAIRARTVLAALAAQASEGK